MSSPDISLLDSLPLIAILRGLTPPDAVAIGEALVDAGFLCLEVPLNSPDPLTSISRLRQALDGRALVGAGTVLTAEDARNVADAGGQLAISPNTDVGVIAAAKSHGLLSLPGFFTPSEAFSALAAGADGLKLFPAELSGPAGLRAMRAVLPGSTRVYAVGGVSPDTVPAWVGAGASGFGIGTSLYRPGQDVDTTRSAAARFVSAWTTAQ
ncbi:2-dehydro-3-deoxy-6-phosphogalactonate aldolase [Brevundimonas sp. VNH65]|uniref:2-dehydro-3-deoxy-6-phosphogalactonate aldolase n=1 Tax=Brevundimonas sp. VNH65 TaxID=3400917 RepID=UPI003C112706